MILNFSKGTAQKQSQNNLMSSQSFLQKNKITVNEVTQAHYTVEGIQAYSPEEIKALKKTQQSKKQIEGTPVQVKVYQLDGYFVEFQEEKKLTPKEKVEEALKSKSKLDMKNESLIDMKTVPKEKIKITNRDKMMQNNNALVKLERQRGKKSAIEQKLQKLSKHYKEYFAESKDPQKHEKQEEVDNQKLEDEIDLKKKTKSKQKKSIMYESLKKMIKSQDQEDQQSEQQSSSREKKKIDAKNKADNISFKKDPTKAISVASTHQTKSNNFMSKKPAKLKQEPEDKSQSDKQNSQTQSKGKVDEQEDRLDSISEISRKNKSTYSQKLGSAVHLLFM